MKTRVLMRGSWLTSSGYGVAARQLARWLLDREQEWNLDLTFQCLPWGTTPWMVDPAMEDGLIGKIISRTKEPTAKFDASIQIQLPNEWDPQLAEYNIGFSASVETDKCHPDWVKACNGMNAVVFPSEHSRKSITNVGRIESDNYVVHEAFGAEYAKDPKISDDERLNFSTKFNFLIVSQLTATAPDNDRKNILNCIKWLCETFPDDPEVGIVLKTNLGRHTIIDCHNVEGILYQVTREIRKTAFPKIHLVHGMMTDAEMAQLYRSPSVKALVSPTRGEGFGLPLLEAAVSGLPVVATGWSGHTEFLGLGKSIVLDYDLVEIPPQRVDNRIFVPGARWARVNEQDFKKKVKKFRASPAIPQEWARDLQSTLKKTHSQKAMEKKLDDLFQGALKKC